MHVPDFDINRKKEKEKSKDGQDSDAVRLGVKEILDKIGFGFGSQQFLNILFLQTGASIFLIGLINILRVVFGNFVSLIIGKFQGVRENKRLVSLGGIVFGFSFLIMAIAMFLKSTVIFASAILIGSISIVFYGESIIFFRIKRGNTLIERIMKYGLVITAISLFTAAYLMDNYPASGKLMLLSIYDMFFSFKVYGYLIVFEIAAISFILAGYILAKTGKNAAVPRMASIDMKLNQLFELFVKNRIILLLIITNIIVSLAQIVGYSYYGIFIYQKFGNVMFGGFLNVAMVFLISVFTSFIGYFITRINAKAYRKFPTLIFGVILLAFMPLAYFLNLGLIFITIGTIIGVIGGSIFGVTNSLLAIDLISHEMRQAYFSFINFVSIPFFLVLAPLLAYITQIYGLSLLFMILTVILGVTAVMLLAAYFIFNKELV